MMWPEVRDLTGSLLLSTNLATEPVIKLLGVMDIFELKTHLAIPARREEASCTR